MHATTTVKYTRSYPVSVTIPSCPEVNFSLLVADKSIFQENEITLRTWHAVGH